MIRRAVFLLLILPLAAGFRAQAQSAASPRQAGTAGVAPQEEEAAATYAVEGVVLNKLTGAPVARALVSASSDAAFTDQEGRFSLQLAAGRDSIFVVRPGYDGATAGGMRTLQSHSVNVSEKTPELTFYLTPDAEITGHVTAADGDEPDAFQFRIYSRQIVNHQRKWVQSSSATADSDGVFELTNLKAPAEYLFCSQPRIEGGLASPKTLEYNYPPACFPGGGGFDSAAPLSLAAGQKAEVEIALSKQPFYPVSIAVQNALPGPAPSLHIRDQGGLAYDVREYRDASNSTRVLKLPNGSYSATERIQNGESNLYGRVDFKVNGGPVTGLSMTLQPAKPITLEIHTDYTMPESATFTDATGKVHKGPAGVWLTWSQTDNSLESDTTTSFHPADESSDDGLYKSQDTWIEPGRYWVQSRLFSSGGYVSAISSGGRDLTSEPLVVGAAGMTAPIEITLRNDEGDMEVTVNDPDATDSAVAPGGEKKQRYIYLIPQSSSAMASFLSQSSGLDLPRSDSSPYRYGNLAPGVYSVAAFDSPQEFDARDADERSRIAARGKTVTVTAGVTTSVQVDLITTSAGEGNP